MQKKLKDLKTGEKLILSCRNFEGVVIGHNLKGYPEGKTHLALSICFDPVCSLDSDLPVYEISKGLYKIYFPAAHKKDLSVIAKELFPNLVQDTYEQLLYSYNSGFRPSINPEITLNEAISKYTAPVLNVLENKANWKTRGGDLFVDFRDFLTVFDEFFPLYKSDNGIPYMDIGIWNYANGEKIVRLLITEIFYLNYTGMDIRDIAFIREAPFSPEIIRIFLKLSDIKSPPEGLSEYLE